MYHSGLDTGAHKSFPQLVWYLQLQYSGFPPGQGLPVFTREKSVYEKPLKVHRQSIVGIQSLYVEKVMDIFHGVLELTI